MNTSIFKKLCVNSEAELLSSDHFHRRQWLTATSDEVSVEEWFPIQYLCKALLTRQYSVCKCNCCSITCRGICWLCSSAGSRRSDARGSSAACSHHLYLQRSWFHHTAGRRGWRGTRTADRSAPRGARWARSQEERSLCSAERNIHVYQLHYISS